MQRPRILVALLALTLVVAGCGSIEPKPSPSSLPSNEEVQAPEAAADRPIKLSVRLGSCISDIGCRARGSLTPFGMPEFGMVNLFGWPSGETEALPSTLKPGRYTARIAFVMPTDDIVSGDMWQPIAECEEEVLAQGIHLSEAIELVVGFDGTACEITQTSAVADT